MAMSPGQARLADHLASLDAARFVGRDAVLTWFDGLLNGSERSARVVLVHGPGGIGKSALLREIGRRAVDQHERPVWAVDGRSLEPVPGDLESILAAALDRPGAVVLIDSFERILAQDSLLRDRILPRLPADAVVVVAGREAPSPAWFRGGWEHVSAELPLGPLPPRDAAALLAALGVTDPVVSEALIGWAGGSPLALSLAASARGSGEAGDLVGVDLHQMILRRLGGDELGAVDAEVVEVAAVARAVDARLLAAVLPGRSTRAAGESLRRCSVAELVGGRVTLHDLVRSTLRDELRRQDPARYGRLRCRIADHLYGRAADGESRLLSDLVELVDDPVVRWGLGADVTGRFRIDPWRADEVSGLIDGYVARMGDRRWWDDLAPLLDRAPETGLVARGLDGVPLAFCVAVPAGRAPVAAEQDAVLSPVLSDARNRNGERAMVFRESFGVTGAAGEAAVSVLRLSAVLRSGEANIERSYILDTAVDAGSLAFFEAVGAQHHPHLDAGIGGRHIECWVIDHGPGGMLGQVRDVVHAEAGALAASQGQRHDQHLQQAALDALRVFNRPDALAANPLLAHPLLPPVTTGGGPDGGEGRDERDGHDRSGHGGHVGERGDGAAIDVRIGRLRAAVTRAVAIAFGEGPDDRLLRQVVELGDLDPTVNHDQAIVRLAVSRATYFRRLRQARRRVAATLAGQLRSPST